MPQFRWLLLTTVLTLQLAACGSESAADRKAKEEAAINAGTASPSMLPGSPAARAADAEAAATVRDLGPPPPYFKNQTRACAKKYAEINKARRRLERRRLETQRTVVLNADLETLVLEIATANDWYKANCAG